MLAYTTATGTRRGWDAFDRLILRAVAAGARQTVDDIARRLPAGISFHLVHRALDDAVNDGLVIRTVGDAPLHQITPAGLDRLAATNTRGHKSAA
jgi:hypothetical protein